MENLFDGLLVFYFYFIELIVGKVGFLFYLGGFFEIFLIKGIVFIFKFLKVLNVGVNV